MALADIDHFVFVIMENRSFDHMLGYLSIDNTLPVEGLKSDPAWRKSFANEYQGKSYELFQINPKDAPCSDPQHDRQSIELQISKRAMGQPSMGGFVESYARFSNPKPPDPSGVMGFLDAASVPTFDFWAKHYCICDHWFSSLPLGTQANRLMAMGGESKLSDNATGPLPYQRLVYEWLTSKKIQWRAYQSGDFLPFFCLMPRWTIEIMSSLTLDQIETGLHFRRYAHFERDWLSNEKRPSVTFIEPEYTDGPHSEPNDDHAPTGVEPGQKFLADIYNTLIANPEKWAKTLLVVTYDEHGGFFDHVPPLNIPATINGIELQTTGVRVPAFLISPHVKPGQPFNGALDHTSILQLLDDRFIRGEGYSVAVNERQTYLNRILNALQAEPQLGRPPKLEMKRSITAAAKAIMDAITVKAPSAPPTPNAEAFKETANKVAEEHPHLLKAPGWEKLDAYLARPTVSRTA